jgi:hypothetical protein
LGEKKDVLRPENVSANDFPHLWQSSSQEKKVSVPQSKIGANVLTLNDAFKQLLNMHPVQIAGLKRSFPMLFVVDGFDRFR